MTEKDPLGDRLRDKEKADEDRFFVERDRALLRTMRNQDTSGHDAESRAASQGRCPACGERLVPDTVHGIECEACPAQHGLWLGRNEIDQLVEYEKRSGWFTRYLERIRRPK